MAISEGLLLGLSTGVICVAYCGPVLVPYLMGEGNTVRENTLRVSLFLAGRLIAYAIVGVLAALLGKLFLQPSVAKDLVMGIMYIALSCLLIAYGFYRFKEICLGRVQHSIQKKVGQGFVNVVPVIGGIATGLNLCPPFLLAITRAMDTGDVTGSVLFFMMFFTGTTVYFVPFPFIGFFRRQHVFRIIGKFAAIITGLLYFYMGLVILLK
jgi:sulfite exporter TauE/SafE